MNASGTLTRARAGDEQAFRALTDPYRRELQLHCYRILGSMQDAEDALQETMLAAWRGLDGFEERSSLRAWLYRIATNRCLNALRASARRPARQPGRPLRFADAFEIGDLDAVLAVLSEDAWVTMPPEPFEYQGHDAIAAFLGHAFAARWQQRHRLIATRANGQPAFGHYIPDPQTGIVRGVGLLVLTLEGNRISHITRFGGPALLASFGLPRTLPAGHPEGD